MKSVEMCEEEIATLHRSLTVANRRIVELASKNEYLRLEIELRARIKSVGMRVDDHLEVLNVMSVMHRPDGIAIEVAEHSIIRQAVNLKYKE